MDQAAFGYCPLLLVKAGNDERNIAVLGLIQALNK
jgi:hypothetical protein